MIDVLTDELLANAERLYLRALARGETALPVYHGDGGVLARAEQRPSAEEKKWPI